MSSNPMSDRGVAILRAFGAAFASLDDFRQSAPAEAATVIAAIVNHVRSSDPMAAVPSIEMPIIASPVVTPAITPITDVARELHDGAKYRLMVHGGDDCITLSATDTGDTVIVAFDRAQAEQLQADIAAVRAAVRR